VSGGKQYRDPDWLREQYQGQFKSLNEIADECGCASATVYRWLNKHDIDTRDVDQPEARAPDKRLTDSEWIREQYVDERRSMAEIAEICDCHLSTVRDWFSRHGIETISVVDKRLKDAEWLREKYIKQQADLTEIAEECDCTAATVSRWLDNHGVETRTRGGWEKGRREQMAPDERLTEARWLREQYVDKKRTCADIAEECDCSETAVQGWLGRHSIEMKPSERMVADARLTDPEWLREEYVEKGRSGHKIADQLGCSWNCVYTWLNKHSIETRKLGNGGLTGPDHPNWNGGPEAYGPGWNDKKRQAVRDRDGKTCQDPRCSVSQREHIEAYDEKLHVHHLRKARDIDDPTERNAKENLITLCRDCHKRWEKMADAGLVPEVDGR
jgi:transposase